MLPLAGFSSSLALAVLMGSINAAWANDASFPSSPLPWTAQALSDDIQEDSIQGEAPVSDEPDSVSNDADEFGGTGLPAEERGDRIEPPPIPEDFAAPQDSGNTIILGQPAEAPYVVAIPGSREELLNRVQAVVPQAFLTDSRRGRYVQAGAFPERSQAEALSCQLRHQGFDARVVYFRVR